MRSYLLRRLALALVTLAILIVVIFILSVVVPGDTSKILTPRGTDAQLEATRIRIGFYDPWYEKFGTLLKDIITFDFGKSFATEGSVRDIVFPAALRSALLVGVSLIVVVPISVAGGVIAGRNRDSLFDRAIVTVGLASASIPDFVTAVILQFILAIKLGWFEALASAPADASIFEQLWRLALPVLVILIVYFGYIARITRAGVIEAYESDYVRTAYMKGLPESTVVRRHVLRNALQPAVAVIGTQIGFMMGGLLALEVVFDYKGIGNVILGAALKLDPPVLQASILLIAIVFMVATLIADLVIAWMNPRQRLGGSQ